MAALPVLPPHFTLHKISMALDQTRIDLEKAQTLSGKMKFLKKAV
jgi:hypothetical protein